MTPEVDQLHVVGIQRHGEVVHIVVRQLHDVMPDAVVLPHDRLSAMFADEHPVRVLPLGAQDRDEPPPFVGLVKVLKRKHHQIITS